MKKIILWIWQLPQNLIGFIWTRFAKDGFQIKNKQVKVWYLPCFNSGIALGDYIIIDTWYKNIKDENMTNEILHETGHQKQSRILGPLYLLIVGIPSLVRNVWDRLFHKKWTLTQRLEWYYSGFSEKQADRLGGVKRP